MTSINHCVRNAVDSSIGHCYVLDKGEKTSRCHGPTLSTAVLVVVEDLYSENGTKAKERN